MWRCVYIGMCSYSCNKFLCKKRGVSIAHPHNFGHLLTRIFATFYTLDPLFFLLPSPKIYPHLSIQNQNQTQTPIDHVVMNHQNQTRTNGIWSHVCYTFVWDFLGCSMSVFWFLLHRFAVLVRVILSVHTNTNLPIQMLQVHLSCGTKGVNIYCFFHKQGTLGLIQDVWNYNIYTTVLHSL
jgi:hypothetical protein